MDFTGIYRRLFRKRSFFEIITPVFEGALPSLEKLANEIREQDFENWNWNLCTNGECAPIRDFVKNQNDPRIVHSVFPHQNTPTKEKLLGNIYLRRDYSIKNAVSPYILMLDADVKILKRDFFQTLSHAISKNPGCKLIVYNIYHPGVDKRLPLLPFQLGGVDTANYCFSRELALEVGYPCKDEYDESQTPRGDFIFLQKLLEANARSVCYIDTEPLLCWNGNNTYENICTKFNQK